MKKKLIALIFSGMVLSTALTGCNFAETEKTYDPEDKKLESMFVEVEVEKGLNWKIVYDKETKVMYVVSMSSYNRGNFTLLVDEQGAPKLWDGE